VKRIMSGITLEQAQTFDRLLDASLVAMAELRAMDRQIEEATTPAKKAAALESAQRVAAALVGMLRQALAGETA
jgi:hypothetical protein